MNIRNLADIFSIIAVLCRAAGQVTFSGNFFAAKDEPFIVTTSKNGSPITLKDGTKAGYFHLAFDYQLTDFGLEAEDKAHDVRIGLLHKVQSM